MKATIRATQAAGHFLPGHKTFSLVLWKQAVEILKVNRLLSAYKLACLLGCTEKTAEGIVADYRKMKRETKPQKRKSKKT